MACPKCHHRQLYGAWPCVADAVGNLAMSFVNWPALLASEFVDALRHRFGVRVVVIDERL